MSRKSKAKFELKGHALPGINQKSETTNNKDGRSPSSAFQMESPMKKENTGYTGANINPMTSYDYKETSNLPSFRDMFSLEQQQEAMKKWKDKRAKRKEEKSVQEEKERQERVDEFAETLPEVKKLELPETENILEKHIKPVELKVHEVDEKEEIQENLNTETKKLQPKDKSKTTNTATENLNKAKSIMKDTNLKILNNLLKNPNLSEEQKTKIQGQINQLNAR